MLIACVSVSTFYFFKQKHENNSHWFVFWSKEKMCDVLILLHRKKTKSTITILYHSNFCFQLKLVATICVLLVMIEYTQLVDATNYPHENQSTHLRQKRGSPDFFGKIKSVSEYNRTATIQSIQFIEWRDIIWIEK